MSDAANRFSNAFRAAGRGIPVRTLRGEAVLVPPQDCEVFVLDVPPLAPGELENVIRLRLRAQYPGNGETRLDWRQVGSRKDGKVLAVAMREDRLAEYGRAGVDRRLLSAADLASAVGRERADRCVIVAFGSRFQLVSLRSGTAVAVSKSSPGRLLADLADLRPNADEPLFLTGPDTRNAGRLLDAAGIEYALREVEAAATSALRRGRTLFAPPRRGARYLRPLALSLLAVAAAALLATGALGVRRSMLDARGEVEHALAAARRDLARQTVLMDELDALQRDRAANSVGFQHPYPVVSHLADLTDGLARIERLTVRGAVFELSAVGTDALAVLERFLDSPRIAEAELRQIVPERDSGRDRFVITGSFHE